MRKGSISAASLLLYKKKILRKAWKTSMYRKIKNYKPMR